MKESMKTDVYKVYILLGRVGEFATILSATCECAAGYVYCLQMHNAFICLSFIFRQSASCTHVSTVLHALEHLKKPPSSTAGTFPSA